MNGYWKHRLKETEVFQTDLFGYNFGNRWGRIYPDGKIEVYPPYAWDGASPKFVLFDMEFGTNDGRVNPSNDEPILKWPTCMHDWLMQFRRQIGVTPFQANWEFHKAMRFVNFEARWLYTVGLTVAWGIGYPIECLWRKVRNK